MLLFLVSLIYGCNAVPLNKFIGFHNGNDTTMASENFLETIKAGPKKILSEAHTSMASNSFLDTIKVDPKKFVSETQKLDPESVRNIVSLLEELLKSSKDRESDLRDFLDKAIAGVDDAQVQVDDAAAGVLGAETGLMNAQAAQTAAQESLDTKQGELQVANANLEAKVEVKDNAQMAHDSEIDSLNEEQNVLQQVIDMLNGLPSNDVPQWEVVGVSGTHTLVDHAFWTNLCGPDKFKDLTVADTILVEMGDVKDYFHPGRSMTMCHFLLNQDYSWSSTEDGEYVTPSMYGHHFGGSAHNWPVSIDGRAFISFWGGAGANGGCCHYRSNNYGGVDGAAWQRAFTLSVKYAA